MNRKRHGELSELAFLFKATGLGFHVSKPYGDSSPYDFVVEHLGRLSKVQVKSTTCLHRCGGYVACLHSSKASRYYSAADVDYFAVHVIPLDAWYILPFAAAETGIYLNPRRPERDRRFGLYREAWYLLEGFTGAPDLRFAINIDACADPCSIEWQNLKPRVIPSEDAA